MKKPVQLRTEYGPLELEVLYCDGPDCTQHGIEHYLVQWYTVTPTGVSVSTMSDLPVSIGETHYCSTTCLAKALGNG